MKVHSNPMHMSFVPQQMHFVNNHRPIPRDVLLVCPKITLNFRKCEQNTIF